MIILLMLLPLFGFLAWMAWDSWLAHERQMEVLRNLHRAPPSEPVMWESTTTEEESDASANS